MVEVAGLTHEIDQAGGKRWLIVGWSSNSGWVVTQEIGSFSTKDEATAEF